jgi:diguanylate cyclase (GGDEF)-like protein
MHDLIAQSIAPFFVVLLDMVLIFFFVLMAFRGSPHLRARFVVFSLVFAVTLPIDIGRFLDFGSGWSEPVNTLWSSIALYGLTFLFGVPWKIGAIVFAGSAALVLGLYTAGVSHSIIDSVGNTLLALTGMVVAGRLYLRTRGFASANLTALWFLFLIHGASFHLVAKGGPVTLAYGFLLAVLIMWCQAIFGYLYLPRELEGRVPVRLSIAYPIALAAAGGVLLMLFNVLAPLLAMSPFSRWPGTLALGAAAGVLAPLGAAFLHRRITLAVHADEVEQRLAERTAETLQQRALLEEKNRLLEQKTRELMVLAATDPLTGLANRRAIEDALHIECARSARYGTPLSCILLDIDHFKSINDTHGHDAGDAVLVSLANTLRAKVRTTDYAARLGGEEFLVVCPETDAAGALTFAERLRDAVERDVRHGDIKVTVSGGVATYRAGDAPDTLVQRADAGLYRAKGSGRNLIDATEAVVAAGVNGKFGVVQGAQGK